MANEIRIFLDVQKILLFHLDLYWNWFISIYFNVDQSFLLSHPFNDEKFNHDGHNVRLPYDGIKRLKICNFIIFLNIYIFRQIYGIEV